MLGVLHRAFDRFRGSGAAAVTIPSLDGAFRPNQRLEEAAAVLAIAAPDNLAGDGRRVYFSSGNTVLAIPGAGSTPEPVAAFDHAVSSLDAHSGGALAVGVAGYGVVLRGGAYDGKTITTLDGRPARCPTAVRFVDSGTVLLCLGSQQNPPEEWRRDLLDGNASGSVWSVDLTSGRGTCLADRLGWPNGVVKTPDGRIIVSEAWRHRLADVADLRKPVLGDLPGYPARLAAAADGGYWLAIFAPRSQLVEFVLRERRFRESMMREVDPRFWVAPSLHRATDYRDPLQSGAIKQLGELKPWSPSRSYGLVARLDAKFNPVDSFHSRANGTRHGVTACLETGGRLLVACRGGDVVLGIDVAAEGERR